MIRRDYLLRMIEEFAGMLRRLRGLIESRDVAGAGVVLDDAFLKLTGAGAEATGRFSETELLASLTTEGPTQALRQKTSMLIALLQEAGEVHAAAGRDSEAQDCWIKALNLLLLLQLQDADFELPEFVPQIEIFRSEIDNLPLRTQAALWRNYERIGDYAHAEDALFALLKAEPENPELRKEGRAFYERLLRRGDSAMEAGNLPRAEVEAGLAEFQG